ncbi:MAG: glutathione S-transferase family protein [Myxococcota bacterium]
MANAPAPASGLRLWGIGTGRTMRPLWLLNELGLEFELRPILTRTARMDEPEFAALSGRRKIPLFEHDGLMIGESAAICLYLADRFRDHGVFAPEPGTRERTRHDELVFFTMIEMDAILYTIRRHDGLPEVYGRSEVAVEAARAYFVRSAGEFERRLDDDRPHLMGDDFTVADLIAKTCLDWATLVCRIELSERLAAYSARLAARPAFGPSTAQNFPPEAMAALAGKAPE